MLFIQILQSFLCAQIFALNLQLEAALKCIVAEIRLKTLTIQCACPESDVSEQQRTQAAKGKNIHSTDSQAGRTSEPFPYQCQGDKRMV